MVMDLLRQTAADNPCTPFLLRAQAEMEISISSKLWAAIKPEDRAAFTRNQEERNFTADFCQRVQRISFAFDRLCELTIEHFTFADAIDDRRGSSRSYTYTKDDQEQEMRWHLETDLLTFYIYYEVKSITDMLEQWGIPVPVGSELDYALKARDRFLAHPEFCRVSPSAYRGKSMPYRKGFTRCDIASLQQSDPITRAHYLEVLGLTEPVDAPSHVRSNNELVLSKKRNEALSEADVTRIKAFGVREPNLESALQDLALLLDQALMRIHNIYEEAIVRFGYERWELGAFTSVKVLSQ